MTARHAAPVLAIEADQAAGAISLTLRDFSGLVREEAILDARASELPGSAVLAAEFWTGNEVTVVQASWTAAQWRAVEAFAGAAARIAEGTP